MGFPATGLEGQYRNHMKDVKRFMKERHKDNFKVYNLCSEREYDPSEFEGRVSVFPFEDHQAPPFESILPFCQDVEQWLSENEENVCAIHCKAGKGRTGVMICAYLVYTGNYGSADQVLDYYAVQRTYDGKGVTIPSQARYVRYFADFMERGKIRDGSLFLQRIRLSRVPKNGCTPDFKISHISGTELFHYKTATGQKKKLRKFHYSPTGEIVLECENAPVCGDIKIQFFNKKKRIFHFWINTAFVEGGFLSIDRWGLDKLKDKKCKKYPEDFCVQLYFLDTQGSSSSTSLSSSGASSSGVSHEASLPLDGVLPPPPLPFDAEEEQVGATEKPPEEGRDAVKEVAQEFGAGCSL